MINYMTCYECISIDINSIHTKKMVKIKLELTLAEVGAITNDKFTNLQKF